MPKHTFTSHELQYIALSAVMEKDVATIAASVDLTPHIVKKVLDTPSEAMSEHELTIYEGFLIQARAQHHAADINHRVQMTTMLPRAYEVVDHILNSSEVGDRLRAETAWLVMKNAGAPVVTDKGPDVNVAMQVNNHFNAERSIQAVTTTLDSIAETTSAMNTPLPPIGTPSRHITTSAAPVESLPVTTVVETTTETD